MLDTMIMLVAVVFVTLPVARGLSSLNVFAWSASISTMSLYTYTASAVKNVDVIDIIVGFIGGSPLPTSRAATMLHHTHKPSASFLDFINSIDD